MNLTIYDKPWSHLAQEKQTQRSSECALRVNKKDGVVFFTHIAIFSLDAIDKRMAFAYEEEAGEWYVSVGDTGYKVRMYLSGGKQTKHRYPCYSIKSHPLTRKLSETVDDDFISVKFLISRRPIVIDGKVWYKILTKHPLKIRK